MGQIPAPPGRCPAVPAGRARTRGPGGTAGPRRPGPAPGWGAARPPATLPFRFRAARCEAGRQRPAPSCGTCDPRGRGRPGQGRTPRDRRRARSRGRTRSPGHAWGRCRRDRAARVSHHFPPGHGAAVRPDPRPPPVPPRPLSGTRGPRFRKGASQGGARAAVPRGAAPSHSTQHRNSRARKFSCRRVSIEFRPGQSIPGGSGGAGAQERRGEAACPGGHGSGPADTVRAPGAAASPSPGTGGAGGAGPSGSEEEAAGRGGFGQAAGTGRPGGAPPGQTAPLGTPRASLPHWCGPATDLRPSGSLPPRPGARSRSRSAGAQDGLGPRGNAPRSFRVGGSTPLRAALAGPHRAARLGPRRWVPGRSASLRPVGRYPPVTGALTSEGTAESTAAAGLAAAPEPSRASSPGQPGGAEGQQRPRRPGRPSPVCRPPARPGPVRPRERARGAAGAARAGPQGVTRNGDASRGGPD